MLLLYIFWLNCCCVIIYSSSGSSTTKRAVVISVWYGVFIHRCCCCCITFCAYNTSSKINHSDRKRSGARIFVVIQYIWLSVAAAVHVRTRTCCTTSATDTRWYVWRFALWIWMDMICYRGQAIVPSTSCVGSGASPRMRTAANCQNLIFKTSSWLWIPLGLLCLLIRFFLLLVYLSLYLASHTLPRTWYYYCCCSIICMI